MFPVSRTIDRYDATFDHDGLIANASLIVIATLMSRLGLERLANTSVRTGSFLPGRKLCTLVAAMVAGATHIDHVDVLRAGATQTVLGFRHGRSRQQAVQQSQRPDAELPRRQQADDLGQGFEHSQLARDQLLGQPIDRLRSERRQQQ